MYTDNALMFPRQIIPSLRSLRGQQWQTLVDRVAALPECHEETLAFMLMMIQLNGCLSCETDSFRAMRGCCACAQQTLRRFKGSDDDLLTMFDASLDDVRAFARKGKPVSQLIKSTPVPAPAVIPVAAIGASIPVTIPVSAVVSTAASAASANAASASTL